MNVSPMESQSNGFSLTTMVLLFFVFLWLIFGRGTANAYDGGCDRTSNCDVEKQSIIGQAQIRYDIEANANRQIQNDNVNTARLYDQAARQYDAQQSEKIFDLKINAQTTAILQSQELHAKDAKIALLEKEISDNAKFQRLADGQRDLAFQAERNACETPKRPTYYADGYYCRPRCNDSGF